MGRVVAGVEDRWQQAARKIVGVGVVGREQRRREGNDEDRQQDKTADQRAGVTRRATQGMTGDDSPAHLEVRTGAIAHGFMQSGCADPTPR